MAYEKLIGSFLDLQDGDEITEPPEEGSDEEEPEVKEPDSDKDDEGIDLEDPEE